MLDYCIEGIELGKKSDLFSSFQIRLIEIGFRFSDVDRENKTTSI